MDPWILIYLIADEKININSESGYLQQLAIKTILICGSATQISCNNYTKFCPVMSVNVANCNRF